MPTPESQLAGPRTVPTRRPDRVSHEVADVTAVLDEALFSHLSYATGSELHVLPMMHSRRAGQIFYHMSTGSRLALLLRTERSLDVVISAVILDGLVFAGSAIKHSVNHRSVVIFGVARLVEGDPRELALAALLERFAAGRSGVCRPPTKAELAGTAVIEVEMAEASVKSRAGGPLLEPEDDPTVWRGEIPLRVRAGIPVSVDRLPLPPALIRRYYYQ